MAEERCEGDPNSYANPKESLVTHIDMHLEVDFQERILKGYVDLTIDRIDRTADLVSIMLVIIYLNFYTVITLVMCLVILSLVFTEVYIFQFLDTRDLTITTVRNKNNLNKLPFELNEAADLFGSKLKVILPKKSGKK